MAPVVGEQDAALSDRKSQDVGVRHSRVCVATFERGQHVVSQASQLTDNRQSDALIRIKAGH
jgi:hypothetical protein